MKQNEFFGKCVKVITRTSPSGYRNDTYVIHDINDATDWRGNYIGTVLELGGNNIERMNIKEGSIGTFHWTPTVREWNGREYPTNTIDKFEIYDPNKSVEEAKPVEVAKPVETTKTEVNALPKENLPF